MKKYLVILLLAISSIGFCALPPLYQSLGEIESLLQDKRLIEKLPAGDLIMKIERNTDGYLIITNRRTLQVYIEYLKQEYLGPAKFKFYFEDPIDTNSQLDY